jgi:L-ascorbate metabolism protein UlaG (beta-lactamase superfamily)
MPFKGSIASLIVTVTFALAASADHAQDMQQLVTEPACTTLAPVSAGGRPPANQHIVVLRWFGYSSYEVAYRGKVILLDAYYDGSRPGGSLPVGITASDIRRADAILVGHAHVDHIQDAPAVSQRTGAPIFVAPSGRPYLESAKVPADRVRILRGGETIKMNGFTIQTALGIHARHDSTLSEKFSAAIRAATLPNQTEERAPSRGTAALPQASSTDPEMDIVTRGTISYVVTFDDGASVAFRDSPGDVSDAERTLVKSIESSRRIDVAIIGYQGNSAPLVIRTTALALAKTYRPKVLLPAHHDRISTSFLDIATEPLFEVLRRELPDVKTVSPLYRSPVCVSTTTGDVWANNNAR